MTKRTLTPVFDGAKDLPVRKGWYLCDLKPIFGDRYFPQTSWARRFWNGRFFSHPVRLDAPDQLAKRLQNTPSLYSNCDLYWCGLTAPYES